MNLSWTCLLVAQIPQTQISTFLFPQITCISRVLTPTPIEYDIDIKDIHISFSDF